MLSKEDNELVTNTNPGTPMGELFRRFWLPVALSEELPGPDCVPVRVKVLGEDLIAFRDTDGNVGLVDAYCPHRGAPMFFGRNEEDGLRCVYHGWKFDVDGECIDLPNAPEGDTFKNKVEIKAYPCVDAGDLIWAYMGPKDKQPPFPEFEWTQAAAETTATSPSSVSSATTCRPWRATTTRRTAASCTAPWPTRRRNPLQQLPQPAQPAHRLAATTRWRRQQRPGRALPARRRQPPRHEGRQSRASRQAGRRRRRHARRRRRAARPDGKVRPASALRCVDADLLHRRHRAPRPPLQQHARADRQRELMFYRLRWSLQPDDRTTTWSSTSTAATTYPEMIPGTWKTKDNVYNDYNVDRLAQKNFTYTGIKTFPLQDIAMMENQWGPIAEREQEHLMRHGLPHDLPAPEAAQGREGHARRHRAGGAVHPGDLALPRGIGIIENGDFDAAIEKAKEKARQSVIRAEAEKLAPS